jgi:glycosyltransferase involved in cell wall biosynthesis
METPIPKVSICIPAYNQTKYLKRVLDSVFEQTFTDFELIVSDDSTTTEVKQLIDTYKSQALTILYHHHSAALGSPENWNFAIRQAKGAYIKIMHHDDWFTTPTSLVKFVELLEKNDTDFAFSGAIVNNENGTIYNHKINTQQFLTIKNNPVSLFPANLIGAPSAVIFKNKFNIQFDTKLKWIVDVEFYYRLLQQNCKITFTEETLVLTYSHDDSITNQCSDNKNVELFEYFYCINKHKINDISVLRFLLQKCIYYNVASLKEIRELGYKAEISILFRVLFFIRTLTIYDFVRIKLLGKGLRYFNN